MVYEVHQNFRRGTHAGSEDKDIGIILTYEWRKHGDDDERALGHFVVHKGTNNHTNHTSLFDDCPCDEHITRCLRIVFIWAPYFVEQVKHVQLVNDLQVDLVIVDPGNPMRREQSYHKSGQLQWRRLSYSRMNIDI